MYCMDDFIVNKLRNMWLEFYFILLLVVVLVYNHIAELWEIFCLWCMLFKIVKLKSAAKKTSVDAIEK